MNHIEFRKKNRIGYIILNRPEKRNALSYDTLLQLENIVERLKISKKISLVIIKGEGKDFCSGHDLSEFVQPKRSLHQYRKIFSLSARIMESFHYLPQVIIAQVQGHATAAGCQLVASCDLAVAAEDACFSTPGVKIGLFCSTPMVPLSRCVGRKQALEMLFTGREITADQAKEYGLVNKVVDTSMLEEKTHQLAEEISHFSAHVLSLGKQTFYEQIKQSERFAYDISKESIAMNCLHDDAQEGIQAMLEKRMPRWENDGSKEK